MTEQEFRNELKSLNGGYLFYGDEDYLKYSYSKEAQRAVLDGSFDDFNHIVLYAEEFTSAVLEDAICSLPMMADKKLVEVRGVDFNALKKDELQGLEIALSQLKDNDHTVLIIRADSDYFNVGRLPKQPSELFKMVTKYLTPVELSFPSASRLKSWILRHFSQEKIELDPSLCDKLVEVCGHDMWALSNEIHTLCAFAKMNERTTITGEDIENVCCQTIEYGDFQLTNALLDKNRALAFETLYRQKSSHEPAPSILASVMRMYTELFLVKRLFDMGQNKAQISKATGIHEFKVGRYITAVSKESPKRLERAIELCREADIKSKSSSNVVSYIAVERLISELCALFCR